MRPTLRPPLTAWNRAVAARRCSQSAQVHASGWSANQLPRSFPITTVAPRLSRHQALNEETQQRYSASRIREQPYYTLSPRCPGRALHKKSSGKIERHLYAELFDHPPYPLPGQEGGNKAKRGTPPSPRPFDFAQGRLRGLSLFANPNTRFSTHFPTFGAKPQQSPGPGETGRDDSGKLGEPSGGIFSAAPTLSLELTP